MISLDGFKSVNDTVGHDIGDRVLVAVAQRLTGAVPAEEGCVARLGGDEFAVLAVPRPVPGRVAAHAEAVLAALTTPIWIDDHEFTISASERDRSDQLGQPEFRSTGDISHPMSRRDRPPATTGGIHSVPDAR